MQAGTAQFGVFFNQGSLQSVLAGANGSCIAAGTGADDGYVVDSLWQV